MCLPVNKLKSSNNVDRVRQAHILFAFKMFLVLTGLLRGQARDTDGEWSGYRANNVLPNRAPASACK